MKLMINASEPNYGVVEDFMIMDSEPVIGKWSVSAKVHNMVSIAGHGRILKVTLLIF